MCRWCAILWWQGVVHMCSISWKLRPWSQATSQRQAFSCILSQKHSLALRDGLSSTTGQLQLLLDQPRLRHLQQMGDWPERVVLSVYQQLASSGGPWDSWVTGETPRYAHRWEPVLAGVRQESLLVSRLKASDPCSPSVPQTHSRWTPVRPSVLPSLAWQPGRGIQKTTSCAHSKKLSPGVSALRPPL